MKPNVWWLEWEGEVEQTVNAVLEWSCDEQGERE